MVPCVSGLPTTWREVTVSFVSTLGGPVLTGLFFTVAGDQGGQWQTTAVTTTGFKYNDQVDVSLALHVSFVLRSPEMLFVIGLLFELS